MAAVAVSFPFGFWAASLVILTLAALEVIGLTIVPNLPSFKASVDRATRVEAREARRTRLLQEIESHGGSTYLHSYEQMRRRVESLYRVAMDTTTALNDRDVQQLDDLTVSYLGLCLSDAVMNDGDNASAAASVDKKLRAVTQRLDGGGLTREDAMQLGVAKKEYEEVLQRHARMLSRKSALEASLVSMPLRMEEVYQMVMTAPTAGNLGALLEESVTKLRTVEEVTRDLDAMLDSNPSPGQESALVSARARLAQTAIGRRSVGSRE